MLDSEVDVLYGIGGVLEGVVFVVVICVLDGDMNGCLLVCYDVKGDNEDNCCIGEQELVCCKVMGIEVGKVLCLDDMVCSDNVIFFVIGIIKGDLLEGISCKGNIVIIEMLLICGKLCIICCIQFIYYLDCKDLEMQVYIF